MPETIEDYYSRVMATADDEGRLAIPADGIPYWEVFPFEAEGLRLKPNTHNLWWGDDADGGAEGQGWLWPGSVGGSFDPELAHLAAYETRVGAESARGQ